MRILITQSSDKLSRRLAETLAQRYYVQGLSPADGDGESPDIAGDIRDLALVEKAVAGCNVIVHHVNATAAGGSALDAIDAATRGIYNLMTAASPESKIILLTSLSVFESCPPEWKVNELWEPRPTPAVEDLAPFLTERTAREVTARRDMVTLVMRLGKVVDEEDMVGQPPDSRWLHIDDAVQAVEKAILWEPTRGGPRSGMWVFHIVGGGKRTRFPLAAARRLLGYNPKHDLTAGVDRSLGWRAPESVSDLSTKPGGQAQRVVIFGAGGTLAGVVAADLKQDHILRLVDQRPIAEAAVPRNPPHPSLPQPQVLAPPHEEMQVDVRDAPQVLAATEGVDAIINCTVVRYDPVESFRVNILGAYNIACAAVIQGIRRIVHTGNPTNAETYPAGYWHDFRLPADVPPRPGTSLYNLSKMLGYEVLRIFAEAHGLEVPVLCFHNFAVASQPPAPPAIDHNSYHPLDFDPLAYCYAVSWEDATQALRLALHAESFPRPLELLHITADLPHGKYSNEAAKRLLGWRPQDRLEQYWTRDLD